MLQLKGRTAGHIVIRLVGLGLGIYSGLSIAFGTVWATSNIVLFSTGIFASFFNATCFMAPARLLGIHWFRIISIVVACLVLVGDFGCAIMGDACFVRIRLLDIAVPILFLLWTHFILRAMPNRKRN